MADATYKINWGQRGSTQIVHVDSGSSLLEENNSFPFRKDDDTNQSMQTEACFDNNSLIKKAKIDKVIKGEFTNKF